MVPIKPCETTGPLFDVSGGIGPMWEALSLTHGGLDDGHPELLFWRCVDTEEKNDPSDGWYNLMISIISIFSLMATTLIRLLR